MMVDAANLENMEIFKDRLATVLRDLQENGHKDPEAMWLLGSLVSRLTDEAGKKAWPQVKAALTPEAYDSLLNTFQKQGNELSAADNAKAAYAIRITAISLIGSRFQDQTIKQGTDLLDALIGMTVDVYRKRVAERATPTTH